MKQAKMPDKNRHLHTQEEERTIREAALMKRFDASFPRAIPRLGSEPDDTTPSIAESRRQRPEAIDKARAP